MAEERAQRRLAAIVAVDVVGYSRLVQADDAGTIAALRAWRGVALGPLVAEHGGRIVKLMGNGALLEDIAGRYRPTSKVGRSLRWRIDWVTL